MDNLYYNDGIIRKVLYEFGLWDQLRIDMGREWSLIMFIQEILSPHRSNTSVRPCISSSSKNVSHMAKL